MSLNFMRPALALALAMSLAACGGKATFPISGTIAGLQYKGLVLNTNGMDLAVAPPAKAGESTMFSFPNALSYGEVYNVTTKAQPEHQTCSVVSFAGPNGIVYNGPSDTAGRFGAINIGVACTINVAALGGKITGLTSAGLQLTNGTTGGVVAPAAGDTAFTLPNVAYGVSYGVTVLAQPANNICTVSANGTGVMGDTPVTNVAVTCGPKPVP